jgi:riboflavin kinase / FMN adenylyltransferase
MQPQQLIAAGAPFPARLRGSIAAIGNFDGVHRGHQRLLAEAAAIAQTRTAPWGIVTFEPHPRSFFRPEEPVFRLTPLPLKARLIAALGGSYTAPLIFNAELASLPPEEFVRRELHDRFGVSHVVTGYDFHFGKGRKGSPETMRELGRQLGFGVTSIEQVTDDNGLAPFASSAIRTSLRHGRVRDAARQLGYWWMVMGEVVEGDKRGRTIGFPTLNIRLEPGAEPFQGIYAVRVRDAGGASSKPWLGAGYFGRSPTFETGRLFLEVFLFDFSGDLYGKTLVVEFIDLIRPDRKFDSIDDLIAQMNKDCEEAKARLGAMLGEALISSFPLGRLQAQGQL